MTNGPVASPCVGTCQIDPKTGLCLGCHRTLDEITAWGMASDRLRTDILRNIARRRAALGSPP